MIDQPLSWVPNHFPSDLVFVTIFHVTLLLLLTTNLLLSFLANTVINFLSFYKLSPLLTMAIPPAVLDDQPLILEDEGVPASKPDEGTTTPPRPVKSGLCMQFFKHKPCQYADSCKNHHLTLDQLVDQKLSLKDEDEPIEEKVKAAVASKIVEKKIEKELYKTKLCTPYQEGECKRGSACSYVHITGPDAKRNIGKWRITPLLFHSQVGEEKQLIKSHCPPRSSRQHQQSLSLRGTCRRLPSTHLFLQA